MKTFFISSTFRDMQVERDILHEKIFPRLRLLIKEFGEDVQEVDLRWGVDTVNMTEEESGHEVLKICIDAIDRCKPYLVVLLGERYGWIPGTRIVDAALDSRISDRYEENMSITELEIQYGALLDDEAFDRCIFCFRDSGVIDRIDSAQKMDYCAESPRHAQRLAALKKQIRGRKNAVILEYGADWDQEAGQLCGLENFEARLYSLLEDMIRNDFSDKNVKSPMERQVDEVELIKQGYLSSYVRRYPEEFLMVKSIGEFQWETNVLNHPRETDCLLLSGQAGSGKSALMAFMAEEAGNSGLLPVLCFAAASGCRDVAQLKRYIAYRLETLLGEPHEEDPASVDELLRKLDKKAKGKAVVCFVDGLDQIYHGQRDPYLDLPAICPNVFWVFSALPDFPFQKAAVDYTCQTVYMEGLHPGQRTELIIGTAGKRGKKLDGGLVDAIAGTGGAENPLFLSLVLQRLFMMNKAEFEEAEAIAPGMEGLHRYMRNLLAQIPDMPERMAAYILNVTAALFDQDQFSEVLMLIATSRNGLTERELADILKLEDISFSQVKFQQTVSYLYDAFTQRSNGKWTFNHRLFTEAVLTSMGPEDHERIGNLLVSYSLIDEEFLRQEGFYYLLQHKNDAFWRVLENAIHWNIRSEVFRLVGSYSRDHGDYRSFFTELSKAHPTDGMASFWLAFDEFLYGKDAEAMATDIVRHLMQAPLSHENQWQMALYCLYSARAGEYLPLLKQAEQHAAFLAEPERSIANAGIQAEMTRVLTSLETPYTQIKEAQRKTMDYIDRAMAYADKEISWGSYEKLFRNLLTLSDNAVSWQDPDTDKLLLRGLEHLERLKSLAGETEYSFHKVRLLYSLCDVYNQKPLRDREKAKKYGDQALALAESAVSALPSVRNLHNKINANKAYTYSLDQEYRYPYLRNCMECARQIYASVKTTQYKRELAYAQAKYAISVLQAIRKGVEKYQPETLQEADRVWEHSCQLLEELIEDPKQASVCGTYASFLCDWAEICAGMGYLNNALKYGNRAVELLEAQKTVRWESYQKTTDPDAKSYELRSYRWAIGWLSQVKGTLASVHINQLDPQAAEQCADDAVALGLERSKTSDWYYVHALSNALTAAQAKYYQRKDQQALEACDYAMQLMEDPRLKDMDLQAARAELLYIRARIALARGENEAALGYYRECEKLKKTAHLYNRMQILKADCLTAIDDPEKDAAWKEALQLWRKQVAEEKQRYERNSISSLKQRGIKKSLDLYWRESRAYALAVYYMGYCYHNYVTTEKRMREGYDLDERRLLYVLRHGKKGSLSGQMPPFMTEANIATHTEDKRQLDDLNSLVDMLDAMTDRKEETVDLAAFDLIRHNARLLENTVPTPEQFHKLSDTVGIAYQMLMKERVKLEQAKDETDLFRAMFPVQETLPVFQIGIDFKGDRCQIWPREYLDQPSLQWQAVLKLLLFVMKYESLENKKQYSRLITTYRICSQFLGGCEEIEKADISAMPQYELESLITVFNPEDELKTKGGWLYWYALKNVWVTELYRRTGNPKYIADRIVEFETFLTDEFEQMYQGMTVSKKKDMVHEISEALQHLTELLAQKDLGDGALAVVKWSETVPCLAGKLRSKTIYPLQAKNEADSLWLNEVKMRCSKLWLEQINGAFWPIRLA